MNRCTRYSDYHPTPLQYQYRYFYPLPIFPATKTVSTPRVHTCGVHSYHPDCNLWSKMGTKFACPEFELTKVRDHALKKILPWRLMPRIDLIKDTSFYTGKGITYKCEGSRDEDFSSVDKFPDLVNASNICSAHAQRSYTLPGIKVSPDEWKINNHKLSSSAQCSHNIYMMLKADARGCIESTAKEQARLTSDTNKDIENRLKEIETWTNNEKDELRQNIHQMHDMLELKERLEVMLKNIEAPLEIAQENMLSREGRQGAELVHDAVEESLLKEIETLRKSQEKLIQEMGSLNLQLTRLRAARHEIEMDIRNKEEAKNTDECVQLLNKLSNEIGAIDLGGLMNSNSSPTTWVLNSQNLIQISVEERNLAQVLYTEISKSMISCADECFNVWYETNSSFNVRLAEIRTAKMQLEKQLEKIKQDIDSLNRHIHNVRKALDDKLPLMKLAQARLEKRKQRPGIELCRDKVMMALYKEIHALKQAIDLLTAKLHELESGMEQLMRTKGSLETDIKLKNVALFVDADKCLNLRHNFPISTFKETRYPKKLASNGLPEARNVRY